ncbi:MAG: PspA/IM30 family protein [Pseudomonadales bacterium]|uniref:PspA/IM30 family protein n=1 Tax=Oleiphilus messinensis TaxID=141451 RepID=A0A1Y0I238_9GAMM|nr:PspA/IM30 family protein [Oleiphilus messinensis]ARU54279.1 PspA/IM30 family protein [Oleiphilus messinensis]MCG8610875.1 PspA/IM30 family protein [Pseudomonadales bacterium]
MSVLKKIMTAFRGGVREMGEAVVDANGIRIFEQEIRDAKEELRNAERNLTEVMAKKMQTERRISQLKEQVVENERYATQALEKGEEALALEVAERLARISGELSEQQNIVSTFTRHVDQLKAQISKARSTIADHERELAIVKTTESVQRATIQVTENIANKDSKLSSARESLDRIKQRQTDRQDRMEAGDILAAETSETSLDDKLKSAGIGSDPNSAAAILARLKSKSS